MAEEIADEVTKVAPDLPYAALLHGAIDFVRGDFDASIAEHLKALELSPSDARILAALGMTQLYAGDFDGAIQSTRKAMRLNPHFPTWYLVTLGRAYVYVREYKQALEAVDQGLARAESPLVKAAHHATKALAYSDSGDLARAREQTAAALEGAPYVSVALYSRAYQFKNVEDWNRFADALRAAGLPEE